MLFRGWCCDLVLFTLGAMLETCIINIEVPNRNRRKKASARKIGLAKLWDFITSVVAKTAIPWRIVIGRFGRLGHGELKGWTCILSKKNLIATNNQIHSACELCLSHTSTNLPCIVSACVISLEVHPTIHVLSDIVKVEDIQSSQCPLHTPRDASTSHILVFPTSSTAQPEVAPQDQVAGGGIQDAELDIDMMGDLGVDALGGDDLGGDLWDLLPGETSPQSQKSSSPLVSNRFFFNSAAIYYNVYTINLSQMLSETFLKDFFIFF